MALVNGMQKFYRSYGPHRLILLVHCEFG